MSTPNKHGLRNNLHAVQENNTIFSFLKQSNANPNAFFRRPEPRVQAPVNTYSIDYLRSLLARMNYLISLQDQPVPPTPKR